jgi:hypothetical protein
MTENIEISHFAGRENTINSKILKTIDQLESLGEYSKV